MNEKLNCGLLNDIRPEKIQNLNNGQGTFLYNFNIKEVMAVKSENGGIRITTKKKEANATMYQYDSLRVEYPKTADNIFATLLTAKYPSDTESKLLNEYKSAELGLLDNSMKQPYIDFLEDRLAIRQMVDADCQSENIMESL